MLQCQSNLRQLIQGKKELLPEINENVSSNEAQDENFHEKSTFNDWLKTTIDDALLEKSDGDLENKLYTPLLLPKIEHIGKLLPIWSNMFNSSINIPVENSISSATSENYFWKLKNDIFSKPLRADEAIMKHLEFIEGSLKIGSSEILGKKTCTPEKKTVLII